MRSSSGLSAFGATCATAVLLVALIVLSPSTLLAADKSTAAAAESTRSLDPPAGTTLALPPSVVFDDYDAIAALDAVRIALTEVGDGGTYVWRRRDGLLSGTAHPTSSFRTIDGRPCRHIVVTLQARDRTRSAEGVACRLGNGRWQLEG